MYELLNIWSKAFPFLQAIPISQDRLKKLFFIALQNENQIVMSLLLNCYVPVECRHSESKKTALNEALSNHKVNSVLFLIAQGAGEEFDFQLMFEFFQTNLMQKESRVTFEQALKQLCHNNFKFFSYYLRQKFLIETTEDEFDVIDPFTNKKFKIKDEQRDFLTEKLKIKSFTVDGLEVEVEPSPKNLFFSRTMQHHAETFFSANLVQPEETLIFKTDKNLSAFSFRFQFKFISLDQIADRNDKLNLVSLTELTALALCFQGDYFDYYHVVLIERSNGNCDFVVRCHHISEIFLSQRLTENILFTLDAVEKNIPQDFFSLKKKQSLSNLEQWFAFFEDTQNNFDSFIAFCQTNKIDPQPIINNVSRKLLLDSENEKVILEFLYRLRLFVDSRQMHTTVVELIERLNPEIAKKVKDNIEEIPNQAVRIQNSKTNFRVPQQHQENQKRTSIFLSTGTKAIFQAFLKDRDEIQNIISDLGNGNFVSFEKLSSISLKQEILEKINLSTLSKRKVLDLFLKRINESFSEYEKKTEKLKNKLDKLRKKNASPQEINAVKQQIKENINPYEAITFIETLSFEGCEKISFSQIKNILEKTKRLTTLNLSGLNLTEKEIDELVRIALVNNTGLKKLVLNNLKNLTVISIATIKADGEKIKYTVKPKLIEVSLNDCSNLTRITMVCAQLEIFSFLKAPVAELVLLDQQITRLDFTTDIAKFHKSAKRSSTLLLQSPQLLNNYKDNNPEIPSVGISSETILNTAASFELLEHRNLSRLMPSEKATWQLRKLILSTEQVGFVVKANVDKFKSNEESRAKRLTLANTSTSKKKGEFSLNVNFFGSQLSVFERLIFNFKYQLNKREFAVYDFTSITEERKFPEIQEVKQFLQNIDDDFFVLTAKEISYFENAAQYKKSISCIKQNGIFSFGILSNGYLVTAEYTGTTDKTKDNTLLRVWDNVSGACLQDITESHKSLKIHVAGENQVVSVHENHVNIWNIFEAKQITSQRFDNEKIQSSHLLFSFSLLALGMNNGTVNLMTLTKGHKIRQFQAFSAKASLNITAIESLQNGCLALGNSNGEIAVLNTVTKQVTPSFAIKGQVNKITSLKFLEGNCLISGNSSGTVNLWDMEKGIVLKSFSFKDIDCILGFDFFSSNQVLCIGVKGIRSLTISETKLSFELIIKYLEKITIKVDHDEVKILISLTVGPDYKKLEADIRKFLTLVFPDLKEGDSNNKYLIYHAKPEQVRAFEQTLKGCGFEQQIQRKERPEALLATRARLNTLLGGNADNKPSAPTTWRTYNNQSANKRLSFIDGGKHRKSTHFDSAPVVIQEVGQNCNNNNQFGNA